MLEVVNRTNNQTSTEISVAPMMEITDHHCRYFLRLISPNSLLYTEMVTSQALKFGDKDRLLVYRPEEQPLALQVAGCSPPDLANAAVIAQDYGFCEVNLNVGCPSDRVQQAKIGACLMAEADLVADCIKAMTDKVKIPVTIKTRIGIDELDSYEFLTDFVNKTSDAGCNKFIIHARKAWLKGLNPKQNRTVPKLDYSRVHRLKTDFPDLNIILNGGIETLADINDNLQDLNGIMIGRAIYNNPYLLAEIEQEIFQNKNILSRYEVVEKLHEYIAQCLSNNIPWTNFSRHYMGLFKGQPGARVWRQFLSESRDITVDNLDQKLSEIISYLKTQHELMLLRKAG